MGNASSKGTTAAPPTRAVDSPSAAMIISSMRRTGARLTESEIDIVVQALDVEDSEGVHCEGTTEEYISTEFEIGEERVLPCVRGLGDHAALEQFDLDFQQLAFQFVKSDHRIEQRLHHSRAWISILGVDLLFFPHQLYAAMWLLVHERGPRRGAILADKMGLGKVRTLQITYLPPNVDSNKHNTRQLRHTCTSS